MPVCRISPPWEFLLSASRNSLQSYELSRLSHASNLRKEIAALVDQWVEENSSAMLARWLMEHRERETTVVDASATAPQPASPSHPPDTAQPSVSDNFLPDFAARRSNSHGRT